MRVVFLPLIIMLLAAGCGQSDNKQKKLQQNLKAITIMANLHTTAVPKGRIEQMLEEQTGALLDIQWIPDGSYEDRVNAALATGTLPQAVFLKNGASFTMFRSAIRDGQFWEIGSLLHEYPNLKRLNPDVLRNISVNGKIYGLYQERPLSRQGVIFRKDWADNLGLQEPDSIEELYNMIERFTNGDPDGNGKRDTIGLADRSDLVYGAFKTVSSYFGTPNEWGEQDGQLLPEFMFPAYMDTMKFFRKLHKEQLINLSFPVTSKSDQQELFVQGRAGVYIGAMSDVVSLQARLSEHNPDARLDLQNRIKGPLGYGIWSTSGYGSVVLFPKSAIASEERLRTILAFFDQLMEPRLANLIAWGIEEEHYVLEKGMVISTVDNDHLLDEVRPYLTLQIGGRNTIPGMHESGSTYPIRAKSEQLIMDNDNMLINDPTTALDSGTFNDKGVRLQEAIRDATYNFILGFTDEAEFQAEVDRWKAEGGAGMIEEFTAANRQRIIIK